jgi:hypothetical protein
MTRITRATQFALPTTGVNLTNNPSPRKIARWSTGAIRFNNPDKLVPNRSIKPRIPARYLQIGITNPRQQHSHEHLVSVVRFRRLCNC